MITLAVSSDSLRGDDVTRALALEPSVVDEIGEPRNARHPEYGANDRLTWRHSWPEPADWNEEGLWERLLAPLRSGIETLRRLDRVLEVGLWLKLEGRGTGNLIWMPPAALLDALGIVVVLDIYDSGAEGAQVAFADALALWDLGDSSQAALVDATLGLVMHQRDSVALLNLACVATTTPLNVFEFDELVSAARDWQRLPPLGEDVLLWRAAQSKVREWRHRHHDLRWLLGWASEWLVQSRGALWMLYGAAVWLDDVDRLGQPVPASLLGQVNQAVRDILAHDDPWE